MADIIYAFIGLIRYFSRWNIFLRDQVKKGINNERVFTVNDRYLTHMYYITKMLGPMKAYSTCSAKKTIKKVFNLISGKTKTGINTSNLLFKLTNYNSNLIEKLEEDTRRFDMANTYRSIYNMSRIPSDCKDAP